MKTYWICSIIAAILIFFIAWGISGICYSARNNKKIDEFKNRDTNSFVVRYYNTDEIESDEAKVYYLRVDDADDYGIWSSEYFPYKSGYRFEGLFDANGTKYIDAEGNGVKKLTKDVLLYPHFVYIAY